MQQEASAAEMLIGKYLMFVLAAVEYGVRVLRVKEIMGVQEIPPAPAWCANYFRGIINLRGKMIPVIDLRLKFDEPEATHTQRTCIIIIQPENELRLRVGLLVDGVSEVLSVAAGDVESVGNVGGMPIDHIAGVVKVKGKTKILLDSEKILSDADIEAVQRLQG